MLFACSLLLGVMAVSPQDQPDASAFDALAGESQRLIARRAKAFYRLPDGRLWDGCNYHEFVDVFNRNVEKEFLNERVKDGPIFYRVVPRGSRWVVRDTNEAKAWGMAARFLRGGTFAIDDPRDDRAGPPLFECALADDFTWNFVYIDTFAPDEYTKTEKRSQVVITATWGDGVYEIEGCSLAIGPFQGRLDLTPDAEKRYVRKHELVGRFFLLPTKFVTEPGGRNRQAWKLLPIEEAKVTPVELTEAIGRGEARLAEWKWVLTDDGRLVWERQFREVRVAAARDESAQVPAAPKGPEPARAGPDLLVLTNGKYHYGWLVQQTESKVTFRTLVGNIETTLELAADQVARVEKGGPE